MASQQAVKVRNRYEIRNNHGEDRTRGICDNVDTGEGVIDGREEHESVGVDESEREVMMIVKTEAKAGNVGGSEIMGDGRTKAMVRARAMAMTRAIEDWNYVGEGEDRGDGESGEGRGVGENEDGDVGWCRRGQMFGKDGPAHTRRTRPVHVASSLTQDTQRLKATSASRSGSSGSGMAEVSVQRSNDARVGEREQRRDR